MGSKKQIAPLWLKGLVLREVRRIIEYLSSSVIEEPISSQPEATQRAELESLVKRLESEKQSWEQVAKEKEAMVASLSKTLERLRESAWAEDAESPNGHDDDNDDQEYCSSLIKETRGSNCSKGLWKLIMAASRPVRLPHVPQFRQEARKGIGLRTTGGKACKLISDSEGFDSIVSKVLVQYPGLPTESHPKPNKLGWSKEGPSVVVTKIYHIPISIVKSYKDTITCEVKDIDACHVLLGRSGTSLTYQQSENKRASF
nr:Asp_protease_2 domain-containing protein [Ipomoea batatas]